MINKIFHYVPRKAPVTIYKTYIRPHFDYVDVVYDKPNNNSFSARIETVQHNACLAITGAIRGTSMERLYTELGLKTLHDRRWYRKLVLFYKILFENAPTYLKEMTPSSVSIRGIHKQILGIVRQTLPILKIRIFHTV